MRTGAAVPSVAITATLAEAVIEMSGKGMGMTAVVDAQARVVGIFTDGDLRRCVTRITDFTATRVDALMTRNPRTIDPHALAIDCVELMETPPKVSQLLVIDQDAARRHFRPDLFRQGRRASNEQGPIRKRYRSERPGAPRTFAELRCRWRAH
jgi:CBS domain-containing protein